MVKDMTKSAKILTHPFYNEKKNFMKVSNSYGQLSSLEKGLKNNTRDTEVSPAVPPDYRVGTSLLLDRKYCFVLLNYSFLLLTELI